MSYRFRAVTGGDLPLLRRWRAAPHVALWWGDWDEADLDDDSAVARWIVELVEHDQAWPIGFTQDYDPHAWEGHHFAHLPPKSRGVDGYLGEADLLDRGHGTAFLRAHVARLFAAGAPAIGIDSHPDNARARRAYEKAGFVTTSGPVDTAWGRVVLMERWREPAMPGYALEEGESR